MTQMLETLQRKLKMVASTVLKDLLKKEDNLQNQIGNVSTRCELYKNKTIETILSLIHTE